jgi:hypothetical protein
MVYRSAPAALLLCLMACGAPAPPPATPAAPTSVPGPVQRCFLSVTTSGDGSITDSMSVQLTFIGDSVRGRLDWLPGAKDRMRGTLEGIRANDTIRAIYTYTAEGTKMREQRLLYLGKGYVAVLTGELEERDGLWVVADPASAKEGMQVPEVACP